MSKGKESLERISKLKIMQFKMFNKTKLMSKSGKRDKIYLSSMDFNPFFTNTVMD